MNPYYSRRKLGFDNDVEIPNPIENIKIHSSVRNPTNDEKDEFRQKWKETHESWKGSFLRNSFLTKFDDIYQKNRIGIKRFIAFGNGSLLSKYLSVADDDDDDNDDDDDDDN